MADTYKGRLFGLVRKRQSLIGDVANEVLLNDGELILSCYGRSTQPIKELLKDAKQQYFAARTNHTTIYRGVCGQPRGYPPMWATVASRHARPMNTVVLDAKQKIDVLSDMNEYLSSAAAAWYADRGIPLRRGYLFHGPPGTGKTSLSFALAGVFGLDIYVMSLFSQLPTRCIIFSRISTRLALLAPLTQMRGRRRPRTPMASKMSPLWTRQTATQTQASSQQASPSRASSTPSTASPRTRAASSS